MRSSRSKACLCQKSDGGPTVECYECGKQVHHKCTKLSQQEIDRIEVFLCSPCSHTKRMSTLFDETDAAAENISPSGEATENREKSINDANDGASQILDSQEIRQTLSADEGETSPGHLVIATDDEYDEDSEPVTKTPSTRMMRQAHKVTGKRSKETNGSCEDANKEWTIEKIISHGKDRKGNYLFQVKWEGYSQSENTFEPRKSFTVRSAHIFNTYIEKHIVPVAKIKNRFGSTGLGNEDNWPTEDEIVRAVETYVKRFEFKKPIDIKIFDGSLMSQDMIYILLVDNHCYTLIHLASEDRCYLADGENDFLKDQSNREQIQGIVKKRIIGLKFEQQQGIDHCAASAVSLCLEFKRLYQECNTDEWTKHSIRVQRYEYDRITKKLSKNPSAKIKSQEETLIHNVRKRYLKCNYEDKGCKKNYPPKERKRLILHQKQCKHRLIVA